MTNVKRLPRGTVPSPGVSLPGHRQSGSSRSVTQPQRVTIAGVVPQGELRASLEAIRDRLAEETNDTLWAKHKRECNCQCGMGDGRLLVALTKRLSEVLAEIAALPDAGEVTKLDRLADELAPRRATRRTVATGS